MGRKTICLALKNQDYKMSQEFIQTIHILLKESYLVYSCAQIGKSNENTAKMLMDYINKFLDYVNKKEKITVFNDIEIATKYMYYFVIENLKLQRKIFSFYLTPTIEELIEIFGRNNLKILNSFTHHFNVSGYADKLNKSTFKKVMMKELDELMKYVGTVSENGNVDYDNAIKTFFENKVTN